MFRTIMLACLSAYIAGCSTSGAGDQSRDALARTAIENAIEADAKAYFEFSAARYASLTSDPARAAQGYAYVTSSMPQDAGLAERAVFSALLIGDMKLAIEVATDLPAQTLVQTELARLTLAVDALSKGNNLALETLLDDTWARPFHAMLARSISAWSVIEEKPDTAVQQQRNAGRGDTVLDGVARSISGLMQITLERDESAQRTFETLWQQDVRLAIGVEAEARLLAHLGDINTAHQRLSAFRQDVGRNPALTALGDEIDQNHVSRPKKLTPRTGAALAIYAATAALSLDADDDLPAVYFTLALHLDPNLDAAKTLFADALDRAGRRSEALSVLRSIPKTSVFHTNAQGQLAWVLRRENQNEAALRTARQTLQSTDDRNIQVQLADLLMSLDRDGEAIGILTNVIDADAARGEYDWRIYFARGGARERLGAWPLAESDLRTALGLKPRQASILNYLGYALIDRGLKLQEGLEFIEKALRIDPLNGSITDSLGWAHYKLGNYDRAVFYLERAIELEPQSSEILDHLGDAYWQVGRYVEAGYQWDRALNYSRDEAERERLAAKLQSGLSMLSQTISAPER